MSSARNPAAAANGERTARRLIAVAFVLVLAPVALLAAGVAIAIPACGCAATPTHPPGWTPWPVSQKDAAEMASRLIGVSVRDWDYGLTISYRPVYQLRGPTAWAFVDAYSGVTLAAVIVDEMPESDANSISVDAAGQAATAFLSRAGVDAPKSGEVTRYVHTADVAYFDVGWTAPGETGPGIEVFVNSSNGSVFAFRDGRSGLELPVPVIGYAAAVKLAGQSVHARGRSPLSEDPPQPASMSINLSVGDPAGHQWTSYVSFPSSPISVDLVTGEAFEY